ncbi:uncharacterized protein LOC114753410 [Neltuma alba]|uniref:uncharacterized protein LOC114753410 n=1 Tax=Neltuma alba TaxID=207710 RepID=UPI0010A4C49C|nr:uncharacterized protein LOC114753410 [Prosopis alba]
MKKLYRKGTVHPSPPAISDQLAFLPATILTLTAALSPEDREVLAYLISCSSSNTAPPFTNFSGGNPRRNAQKNSVPKGASASTADGGDHPPLFTCSCFRCYMSYWIRWDSSPNRQLIHEIIDAFEDWLAQTSKNGKNNRKDKRNKKDLNKQSAETKQSELTSPGNSRSDESESVGESSNGGGGGEGSGEASGGGDGGTEEEEKGSVRRFVSFIGERIWGAWGQ